MGVHVFLVSLKDYLKIFAFYALFNKLIRGTLVKKSINYLGILAY